MCPGWYDRSRLVHPSLVIQFSFVKIPRSTARPLRGRIYSRSQPATCYSAREYSYLRVAELCQFQVYCPIKLPVFQRLSDRYNEKRTPSGSIQKTRRSGRCVSFEVCCNKITEPCIIVTAELPSVEAAQRSRKPLPP
jgi:hypothetical protein